MAMSSEVVVEGIVFPPVARLLGSGRTHFLAGAGVRGLEIDGAFVKFTASGVYLEHAAVTAMAGSWAGKTADELASDPAFFRDIYAGEFDKFTRITFIRPLTGEAFAAKVTENCVAIMEAAGAYTDAEAAAVEELRAAFRTQSFQPGASALFVDSPAAGVLTVAFSKDSSSVPDPEGAAAVIRSRALGQAFLASIIGEGGVSPAARRSIATRMPELLKGLATDKLISPADDAPAQAEPSPVMSA